MTRESNVGCDLDKISIGPESDCRKIVVDGRECLEVSRPYDVKLPASFKLPKITRSYVVDVKRNAKVGDLHVCYHALYNEKGQPETLCDFGFTMRGDEEEFGHYVLWNSTTGELTVSDFLGFEKVCLQDYNV